jgi:cell division protein FtsB
MHVNSLKGIAHRILVLEAQLAFTLEKLSENANDSNLQAEADALKKEIRRLKWRIPLAYLKGGLVGIVIGAVGIVLIL